MFRRQSGFLCVLLVMFVALPAASQVQSNSQSSVEPTSNAGQFWVMATGGNERVRFTTLGIVQQMRLEVINQRGDTVYDSELRSGSLIDWAIEDQQGHRLADGVYGCLVTVEDLSGQQSYCRGFFSVRDGSVVFEQPASGETVSAASDEVPEFAVTVLLSNETRPITFLAHDGKEGIIASGRGDLSFRSGDLFSGKDVEQMRLTVDGRLGLGVKEPAAKLDVAGLIRTSEGILFPDGTVQKTASGGGMVALGGGVYGVNAEGNSANLSSGGPGLTLPGSSPSAAGQGSKVLASSGTVVPLANETGTNNWFGNSTGGAITTGLFNSFFGYYNGFSTTTGSDNSFVGAGAGSYNVVGSDNSFFGFNAGHFNTASNNSFFGSAAGISNTSGGSNGFFGYQAGQSNSTGAANAFFGVSAGSNNTSASGNSFFGKESGFTNTTGTGLAFFGYQSGRANTTASYNTFFGYQAGLATTTGVGNVFIGTNTGDANTAGDNNDFVGYDAGGNNTTGSGNSFFGDWVGRINTTGSDNSFFGRAAGPSNTTESANSSFGAYSDTAAGITNATAIGSHAKVNQSNSLVLGSINGVNGATAGTNVGIGTTTPSRILDVSGGVPIMQNAGTAGFDFKNTGATFGASISVGTAGNPNLYGNWLAATNAKDDPTKVAWGLRLDIGGDRFRVVRVPVGGSPTDVFDVNGDGSLSSITGAFLSVGGAWTDASSREYKENIKELTSEEAINTLAGLNPIKYNYKTDKDERHVGFIAEDVPDLVAVKGRKGLSPMDIVAVLTKVVQELKARNEMLEERLLALESKDQTGK